MIPWSLREVKRKRWKQAQEHEAGFWVKPNAVPPQSQRVKERYEGLLAEMERQGRLGKAVLEVGCGPTCATRVLRDVSHVFADPLATVYRPLCSDSIDGHFVSCLGEQLPFQNAVFDAAFSFNVIDHVISPSRFVAELARVTRPGSLIAVGVYTHPRLFAAVRSAIERAVPFLREAPHPFFLSRESLVRLLRHHNLHIERMVCVHAPERFPALHRQDWIVIARKPAGQPQAQ